jgi:hypothetical protein
MIFFMEPVDDSAFNVRTIEVSWNGSDFGSGISYYELALDDGPYSDMGMEDSSEITNLSEGSHELHLKATDLAGNPNMITVSFFIDLTPPVITIIHPTDGMIVTVDRINATWSGDGGLSPMAGYRYSLDGSNASEFSGRTFRLFHDLTPGVHILEVSGRDAAGNWNTTSSNFTVETDRSTIEIIYPADGSRINRTSFDATWRVNGLVHPILSMEYRIDGSDWTARETGKALLFDLSEGEHALDVRASDIHGNIVASTSRFTVDITGPLIESLSHQGTRALARGPIIVVFSEPILTSSVEVVLNSEIPIWDVDMDELSVDPGSMSPGTVYILNLTVKDLAGNLLKQTVTFTTGIKGTISGRIVDKDGDPVELAEIVFDTDEEVTTSSEGRFSVEVTAGSRSALVYDKDGNEIGSFTIEVTGGDDVDIGDIEVEPKEKEDEFPWWIIGVVALTILLIVGIIGFILVTKGKEEEEDEDEFDDELWEEDEEGEEDYDYDDEEEDLEEDEEDIFWEDEE